MCRTIEEDAGSRTEPEGRGGHVIQFIVYSGPVLLRSNWKDSKNEGRCRNIDGYVRVKKERGFRMEAREIPSVAASELCTSSFARVSFRPFSLASVLISFFSPSFHASLELAGIKCTQSSCSCLMYFFFRESPQSNLNIIVG